MKVEFSRFAQADLKVIYDHIAIRNARAAAHVVNAIRLATRRLRQFPHSGRPGAKRGTREIVVRKLPYIIVY